MNSDIGNPDNCKPGITADGPGIEVMLILFSIGNHFTEQTFKQFFLINSRYYKLKYL